MNQKLFQLNTYITYWLNAVDAHSLHSPFFFNLYTKVILPRHPYENTDAIEAYREELVNARDTVEVLDLGSGSQHFKGTTRKIGDIATSSLSPRKFSLLYRRLIQYFDAIDILELGTSLGINSLFLAWRTNTQLKTLEGSEALLQIARNLFGRAGCDNISLIAGNIDDTLNDALSGMDRIDFALLDANHRFDPTIRYFEATSTKVHKRSIIVIDDIHSSKEMERAWRQIQLHPKVHATADLYRCGLVFFDPSLAKQHFVLQF